MAVPVFKARQSESRVHALNHCTLPAFGPAREEGRSCRRLRRKGLLLQGAQERTMVEVSPESSENPGQGRLNQLWEERSQDKLPGESST